MRIVYLCPDRGISLARNNGSASHVRNMVRSMVALGHEVELVMASDDGAAGLGVPVHRIGGPGIYPALRSMMRRREIPPVDGVPAPDRIASALGHIWQDVAVEQALREVLEPNGADVVYERMSPFSTAGPLVAKRLGVRHMLEVNAPLAWQGARYRGQALNEAAAFLESAALVHTDMIRAISDELHDDLVRAGAEPEKIRTVPCGVNTRLFTPGAEPLPDGASEERFVIGFVGSLKPWHGVAVLADAFRSLAADSAYHLLVVGTGPEAGIVETLARDLPGRVTHVESVGHAEVPGYLKAMDMTVAPYPELERFFFSPLKVLEAMAVGRPVVASSIGQIRLLLRDGETGLLVPPGDAAALADAARRLRAEPQLGRRLGREAATEASRHHSWERRAAEICALAESVA